MSSEVGPFLRAVEEAPVVPVITIADVASAAPLAEALSAGGLGVLEVTLRTPAALPAIAAMAKAAPRALIAAGTVLDGADLARAKEAGAKAALSPGATPALLEAAANSPLAFIPGVATASEAMVARAAGFGLLKFFPAQAAGGIAALKSFAGPLADLRFCPTGGIDFETMGDFLRLANVVAVGGSWMVPEALIAAGRFAEIEGLARAAAERARAARGEP
ncbi:MAG: bifunctional 4-hydroxy-2-oxoglutarate aldolase/2-dehydro-3-deoxy-phosphogluconate aldolase [Pseudomonadota bacterium]